MKKMRLNLICICKFGQEFFIASLQNTEVKQILDQCKKLRNDLIVKQKFFLKGLSKVNKRC